MGQSKKTRRFVLAAIIIIIIIIIIINNNNLYLLLLNNNTLIPGVSMEEIQLNVIFGEVKKKNYVLVHVYDLLCSLAISLAFLALF